MAGMITPFLKRIYLLFYFLIFILLFIHFLHLAAPGLSCGMQDL